MTKGKMYKAMDIVFDEGVITGTWWYNALRDMYLELGRITREDASEVFGRLLFKDWYMDRLAFVKVDEYKTLIWYKNGNHNIAVDDEGCIYRGMDEIAMQIEPLIDEAKDRVWEGIE